MFCPLTDPSSGFFCGVKMANNGFIQLPRSVLDDFLWQEKREYSKFEAWLDLVMFARWNSEPTEVAIGNTVYVVKRGEQIRSLKTLSSTWNWDISKVRRFLKMLQNRHKVVTKSDTQTTRISICNFDTYQPLRHTNENQMTHERTSNEHQTNTIEEREEREERKEGNNIEGVENSKRFAPPTADELKEHFISKGSTEIESLKFYEFYGSKGWMVGKNKMKDWKLAASGWIRRNNTPMTPQTQQASLYE